MAVFGSVFFARGVLVGVGFCTEMAKFDSISTETWKIELPSDWIEPKPDAEEDHYFESADGTKGAYISSWCFRNDARLAAEILESFREVEVSSLHEIKGRSWKALDEWSSKKGNVSTLGGDYLDEANN